VLIHHDSRDRSHIRRSQRTAIHQEIVSARCSRWGTFALATIALALLGGCSSAGGGSGEIASANNESSAQDPIYLDPGQTAAVLGWSPSEGRVERYLVFEARNGAEFTFHSSTEATSFEITGSPGESVQISVMALSASGDPSETSPASAPIVFQAEEAEIASIAKRTASPRTTSERAAVVEERGVAERNQDDVAKPQTEATEVAASAEVETETSDLPRSLRALLIGGDARLPEQGLSPAARDWLQARVDTEISAGVTLMGTGWDDDDTLRDVIWLDAAGQLLVSDGQALLEVEDVPATFMEALQLEPTERFIGLADFDGDGRGEWLLEDTATGEIWTVGGRSDANLAAPSAPDSRLAGHGDFNGDGQSELLWMAPDRTIALTQPGGAPPLLQADSFHPRGFEPLAIADLDGNGRDDLLGRDAEGRLVMALSSNEEGPIEIQWHAGPESSTDGLDLIATLDLDSDGAAELAWLHGDSVEIWSAESGIRARWDL